MKFLFHNLHSADSQRHISMRGLFHNSKAYFYWMDLYKNRIINGDFSLINQLLVWKEILFAAESENDRQFRSKKTAFPQ